MCPVSTPFRDFTLPVAVQRLGSVAGYDDTSSPDESQNGFVCTTLSPSPDHLFGSWKT